MVHHHNKLLDQKWRTRERSNGQALVEFMLVLPLLILIIVGVLDLGRGIYAFNVVSNSAREGARFGILQPDKVAEMKNYTISKSIGLEPSSITVDDPHCTNIDNNPSACTFGMNFIVTVHHLFTPVTPFFGTFTVTGKASMTIE